MRLNIVHLLSVICTLAAACGTGAGDAFDTQSDPVVASVCTALTIRGTGIDGTVCGGSSHAHNCSPGAVYQCNKNSTSNNCTLVSACASGCITGSGSQKSNDTCFAGAAPLALPSPSLAGGTDAPATVTLADAHAGGAIVNMTINRSDLVAARASCNVPSLAAGTNSATFSMPTAVVAAPTDVSIFTDIAYTDAAQVSRELVSHALTLTLNPGGTAQPPPPLASFTLSPSTISPGGVSQMNVVLQKMAPISGVQVSVASSDPAVAAVIAGGQPFVQGGCTAGGGASTVEAAASVAQTTTVGISASAGAPGETPLTNPLTVAAGCTPKTCLDLVAPACSGPDGCGGTLSCGCNFGQTCGGGGTPGVCGSPTPTLSVASLSVSPTTVTGGTSATGTVTLSAAAPAGGSQVTLSSSSASATVPASVLVPAGQVSASFTIATAAVSASTPATISASLGGTQSAALTIAPAGVALPATLAVTATGRTGVTVVSTPAGISVPVGQTGSATFAAGTSVTLSLTDRTAIWSGACATSRDTSTCTFTLTGDASVTANVQ
ncbi:MAG TPA: hypothetical protein VFL36_06125 [Myxococcales bacterium]|nr:hypothetical protein [Myxococcales bacterium]